MTAPRSPPPRRIAVTGASGLVGSALCARVTSEGAEVLRLVRRPAGAGEVSWNPEAGEIRAEALEGLFAVVHLAGENIAGRRWTRAFKERIRRSRVEGTALLARTLAGLKRPPAVFLCASAVGYYGERGDEAITEASAPGTGFLAEVCRDWEAAAEPARRAGIRVVHLRFGTVLSLRGGALAKMLPPFQMGLGGRIGSGLQWTSWISLDDAVGALLHLLAEGLEGPVNGVAPRPVTNAEFTATLAKVLRRPALLPVPAFAVRLAFGEMGEALLLSSCRAEPTRLNASGYRFAHATLAEAFSAALRTE